MYWYCKTLINDGYFYLGAFGGKFVLSKYDTINYSFQFGYTISKKFTHSLLVSVFSEPTFEWLSMF